MSLPQPEVSGDPDPDPDTNQQPIWLVNAQTNENPIVNGGPVDQFRKLRHPRIGADGPGGALPRGSFQSGFSGAALKKLDEEIEAIQSQTSFSYVSRPKNTGLWWWDFDYWACMRDIISHVIVDNFRNVFMKQSDEDRQVPPSILQSHLRSAEKTGILALTNLDMTSIPSPVFQLSPKMRLLDLSANKLSVVPKSIVTFVTLKSLFMNQNLLQSLPEELGLIQSLEVLSLSYNLLERLPNSLENLANLRELKLSKNKIRIFPEQIFHLANLEILDLSSNMIEELPKGIASLEKLGDLNCNENQIHSVADDVTKGRNLQIVRLENNRINLNALPDSIFVDSKICQLVVEGNGFEIQALTDFEGYDQYQVRNENLRRNSKINPFFNFTVKTVD